MNTAVFISPQTTPELEYPRIAPESPVAVEPRLVIRFVVGDGHRFALEKHLEPEVRIGPLGGHLWQIDHPGDIGPGRASDDGGLEGIVEGLAGVDEANTVIEALEGRGSP